MSNELKQINDEMIASLAETLAAIDAKIEGHRSVINGTPFVVQLCPGLYLVEKDGVYRGGCLVGGGLLCYSADRIDAAVEHVKKTSQAVFPEARRVHYYVALREERDAMAGLIKQLRIHAEA